MFAFSAMENWGLVMFREVDLLLDEKTASSYQRERVTSVVLHELAHQWFGNLVTMKWWDDLWLNEVNHFCTFVVAWMKYSGGFRDMDASVCDGQAIPRMARVGRVRALQSKSSFGAGCSPNIPPDSSPYQSGKGG